MKTNYEAILKMVEKNKDSFEKFLVKPKKLKPVEDLMEDFSLNLEEATLFAFIFYKTFEDMRSLRFSKLKETLGLVNNQYSEILGTAKKLKEKGYLVFGGRRKSGIDNFFPDITLDEGIFDTLVMGTDSLEAVNFKDIYSITEVISNLIDQKEDDAISDERFDIEIQRIVKRISPELPYSDLIKNFSNTEVAFLAYAIKEYIRGRPETYVSNFSDAIISSLSQKARFLKKVMNEKLDVIKKGLISITYDSRFQSDPEFSLSEAAVAEFFSKGKAKQKLKLSICKQISLKAKKNLFLENELQSEIEKIATTISIKNFKKVEKDLKKHGFPPGMIMLFHGKPGTGKTASAYQLAKQCKRKVLQVDISNIRDKYVGESEKSIKKIFVEYKKAKESLRQAPILIFNEADALVSSRLEVRDSVDQMNNTMQNILLEEMENFEGILIATTNLIENMDSAFSRRFLYKLEFEEPSKKVRKQIWKDKIPDLSETLVDKLSEYHLTGGQIENIARKAVLTKILSFEELNEKTMIEQINQELNFKSEKVKLIGF